MCSRTIICVTWSEVSFRRSPGPHQKQDSIWLVYRCGPSTAAGHGGRLAVMCRAPLQVPTAWHMVSRARRRERRSGEEFALEPKRAWFKSPLGVNLGKVCVPPRAPVSPAKDTVGCTTRGCHEGEMREIMPSTWHTGSALCCDSVIGQRYPKQKTSSPVGSAQGQGSSAEDPVTAELTDSLFSPGVELPRPGLLRGRSSALGPPRDG